MECVRQARSNTYDNPQLESNTSANGGAVPIPPPMYETIQAAQREKIAVLNPVYGPTSATPTSPHPPSTSPLPPPTSPHPPSTSPLPPPTSPLPPPTSPLPPPSKAAPNPVYSETGATGTDVSGLNPVYAAVGKPATPSLSDPPPPRYAYAYTAVPMARSRTNGTAQPPSLKRADSAGYPPPVPMYEELKSTKRSDSVGVSGVSTETGDVMTKNESYGLLQANSPPPLQSSGGAV